VSEPLTAECPAHGTVACTACPDCLMQAVTGRDAALADAGRLRGALGLWKGVVPFISDAHRCTTSIAEAIQATERALSAPSPGAAYVAAGLALAEAHDQAFAAWREVGMCDDEGADAALERWETLVSAQGPKLAAYRAAKAEEGGES